MYVNVNVKRRPVDSNSRSHPKSVFISTGTSLTRRVSSVMGGLFLVVVALSRSKLTLPAKKLVDPLFQGSPPPPSPPCTYNVDVGTLIDVPTSEHDRIVCLKVGKLPNVPSIIISFRQKHSGNHLCIESQGQEGQFCDENPSNQKVALRLFSPTLEHKYVFRVVGAGSASDPQGDIVIEVIPDSSYPSPPLPPGHHAPPPPPTAECDDDELYALAMCADDAIDMGCDTSTRQAELQCLDLEQVHLHSLCRTTMEVRDACLHKLPALLPMEVASAMLLVTASFTLLCTLLRCFCRHFCKPPERAGHPAVSLEEPTEVSEGSEDEENHGGASGQPAVGASAAATTSTRAAPKGGKAGAAQKAAAVADEDEHDDQLPAYTQVVEHSALVVQPLQSSNSASIN